MNHAEALNLVEAVFLLRDIFDCNDKVAAWLRLQNPHLGGAIPIDLFYVGRGHKVLKFIKAAKDENFA